MHQEIITRNRSIIRYNIAGILLNLLLSVSKIITGIAASSHVILLDGINSLSDLLSSAISILSAALGTRKADASHPFGYGRIEYLSSLLITMLIMYVGIHSIIQSVKAILHPQWMPHYNLVAVILMVISLICKAVYGIVMRRKGKQIHSAVMIMTGTESLGDSLISISILIAIAVYRLTEINIEQYLCIGISLLILYTGVRVVFDCMTKILGRRTDPEVKRRVIRSFIEDPAVQNVTNLILHNYGENVYVGSADIEVDENMTAGEISRLSRELIQKAKECGVTITSIGINGANLTDPETHRMLDVVLRKSVKYPSVERVHSFNVDFAARKMSFYIVQKFAGERQEQDRRALLADLRNCFQGMTIEIATALNA
ncbi:MAG: cation transporter [Eubacterium sp.]|nr:cation transporter [Eubacterium sp.]